MNVAQAMVEAFVQEGIDVATGIAGMSIVEFANAVCSNPAIRVCYARHERGAADIADGYGRVTGKPAVSLFTDMTQVVFIQIDHPRSASACHFTSCTPPATTYLATKRSESRAA